MLCLVMPNNHKAHTFQEMFYLAVFEEISLEFVRNIYTVTLYKKDCKDIWKKKFYFIAAFTLKYWSSTDFQTKNLVEMNVNMDCISGKK